MCPDVNKNTHSAKNKNYTFNIFPEQEFKHLLFRVSNIPIITTIMVVSFS